MRAPEDQDAAARGPTWPRGKRILIEQGGAALASLLLAFLFLHLWAADLRVPFDYDGDALYFEMVVKSALDHGWFLTNPSLGAPGVLAMHDFPSADGLHLLLIKILSLGSSDWALLYNLYFLLGFPLITMAALAVLRSFRVAYAPALAVSLLYAFLPARLSLGEIHYFLSIFYQVPLAILVALWVASDDPPLGWRRDRARTLGAVAICVLVAGTGIYYAFFAGALIALAGLWGALRRRNARNALAGLMLTGVILTGLGVQAAPIAVHQWRAGPNPQVAARDPRDAEIFGMRIAQLLLPVAQHRIPALRDLKDRYDTMAPFPGETSASSLGFVGGAGFLVLLVGLLLPVGEGRPRRELWRAIGGLNLVALLIATTGGFGSLFAFVVTPEIRTYARMRVFVAYLALFAVALLLERLVRRAPRAGVAACGLVLLLGLFDQVTPLAVRPYVKVKAHYQSDAALVRAIEAVVPSGGAVLELPYQSFPEGSVSSGGKPLNYWHVRPYLHSRVLRWSYPAMRGRSVDAWVQKVASLPAAALVSEASKAGFDGILIHRAGCPDRCAKMEAELADVLGPAAPRASSDWLAFSSLAEYNRQALAGVSAEERAWRRALAAHALTPRWTGGFYQLEPSPVGPFRWSSGAGVIEIDNGAPFDRLVRITMRVKAANPPLTFALGGDMPAEVATVDEAGLPLERTVRLRPGRNVIRMSADGKPAVAPWDPRRLIWHVVNPIIEEVSTPPPGPAGPSPEPSPASGRGDLRPAGPSP